MGNLHQGHLELVRQAQQRAEQVVVSIFVNPTQFGEGEDFESYPRTLERDARLLREMGVSLLFTPTDTVMYPDRSLETQDTMWVEVGGLSEVLCGASRPGHFSAVATVVSKLFNMVQPDVALFGEKDFQQLLVIHHLVKALDFPVEIVGVPIFREQDGLAMSSRNQYLKATERKRATEIYRLLQWMEQQLESGERDFRGLELSAGKRLQQSDFVLDYLQICNPQTLQQADHGENELVILVAASLGAARLIDNCRVSLR
jgi:pantoate--beta-alanine ligase